MHMSKIRVQVITRRATHLAVDHIVNSVYFDDFNIDPTAGTNWQNFADQVRDNFVNRSTLPAGYGVETKVYDMADAKPRPVKAQANWVQTSNGVSAIAPREVALCLSYFSERNIPRFRGRLYIGPFHEVAERPQANIIASVKDVAVRMQSVGGADVDWGLWSTTRNAFSKITAGWVDNEWDTVRSRGLQPTTRDTYTTNE
jgi:hypothetical protein